MHLDAEAFLDQRHQPRRADAAMPVPVLVDERQDLGRDLVRAAWAAPLREQARKTSVSEGLDHPETGRQRNAEALGGLGQGEPVDAHQPDHLVADLQQVVRIEEVAAGEPGVAHAFGMGIERAGSAQAARLVAGVVGGGVGHDERSHLHVYHKLRR